MNDHNAPYDVDVSLVWMPSALVHYPSIQIANLAGHLRGVGKNVTCHFGTLEMAKVIGVERYNTLAQYSQLFEILFSEILFDGNGSRLAAALRRFSPYLWPEADVGWFLQQGQKLISTIVDQVCEHKPRIVGFSCSVNQTFACLTLAQRIKNQLPSIKTVFGGCALRGDSGEALLRNFAFIDFAVIGRGEKPLQNLADGALAESVPGLMWKCGDKVLRNDPEILSSETCPVCSGETTPDFSDYYNQLSFTLPSMSIQDTYIPIEASRGCWWGKCAFCGLHEGVNESGFHMHSAETIERIIETVSRKNSVLAFQFTDCLQSSSLFQVIEGLRRRQIEIRFFLECRVNLQEEQVATLALAGCREIQLGIESFSTSILRKMDKGSTRIDNIAAIKLLQEYRIKCQYNILAGFPRETAEDVDEMTELLPALFHLTPPSICWFQLVEGSPIHRNRHDFGIIEDEVPYLFEFLFPKEFDGAMFSTNFEAKMTSHDPLLTTAWQRFERTLSLWKDSHERGAFLNISFGPGFAEILDCRFAEYPTRYILKDEAFEIVRASMRPISIEELISATDAFPEDRVLASIARLVATRIIACEGDEILCLATREKTWAM